MKESQFKQPKDDWSDDVHIAHELKKFKISYNKGDQGLSTEARAVHLMKLGMTGLKEDRVKRG